MNNKLSIIWICQDYGTNPKCKCIICKETALYGGGRCTSCRSKKISKERNYTGSNNPNYKPDKPRPPFYCEDCLKENKKIKVYAYGNRCLHHAAKESNNRPEVKEKISRNTSKSQLENWKKESYRKNQAKARAKKEYIEKMGLSVKVALNTPEVKNKMSVASINNWKKEEYRTKQIERLKNQWKDDNYFQKWLEGMKKASIKEGPNKPEKSLEQLFKELDIEIKYVGNKKFWLTNIETKNRFNPDFVNTKLKKIIEFYGSYWHNINTIVRDKESIETFKYYGYQTLRLFYRDFKNLDKLKEKVLRFYNKPNKLKRKNNGVRTKPSNKKK